MTAWACSLPAHLHETPWEGEVTRYLDAVPRPRLTRLAGALDGSAALLFESSGIRVTRAHGLESSGLTELAVDLKVQATSGWTEDLMDHVRAIKAEAVEASSVTCEACGRPGSLRRLGRAVTRCDEHAGI
jgi:hypothetical protein